MTLVPFISLGTYNVQIQNVRVNFACTKRFFILPAEAIINVRNARLCARCAMFLLKVQEITFSCRLVKAFTFLKRVQDQLKMLLEMCIVQHEEMKSVFTFYPKERLVSKTVKSATPAA